MSRSGGDVCQLQREWDQETIGEFIWHPQGELNRRLCRYHINSPTKSEEWWVEDAAMAPV